MGGVCKCVLILGNYCNRFINFAIEIRNKVSILFIGFVFVKLRHWVDAPWCFWNEIYNKKLLLRSI